MAQVLDYAARPAVLTAPGGFIARMRKAIADYQLFVATVDELAQLSDRDLADLGLHRADIRAIAHRSVYGA